MRVIFFVEPLLRGLPSEPGKVYSMIIQNIIDNMIFYETYVQ